MTDTEIIHQVMVMTVMAAAMPEDQMKDELAKIGAWGIMQLRKEK